MDHSNALLSNYNQGKVASIDLTSIRILRSHVNCHEFTNKGKIDEPNVVPAKRNCRTFSVGIANLEEKSSKQSAVPAKRTRRLNTVAADGPNSVMFTSDQNENKDEPKYSVIEKSLDLSISLLKKNDELQKRVETLTAEIIMLKRKIEIMTNAPNDEGTSIVVRRNSMSINIAKFIARHDDFFFFKLC